MNTPEEIVLYAIDRKFDAIGFSSHGYTPYDLRYCMRDSDGYRSAIGRLKKKYKGKIRIYLGIEEDAFAPAPYRSELDFVIGSSHYYKIGEEYYPIDSSFDYFSRCLEVFNSDAERMGEQYFSAFTEYLLKYKPHMIGHYDLITKFDEKHTDLFLKNAGYNKIAEKYTKIIADKEFIFEANTGAIARGFRKSIYPAENLLHIIKNSNSGLILASDSHCVGTLDAEFEETRLYLKDLGFEHVYSFIDGKFVKDRL